MGVCSVARGFVCMIRSKDSCCFIQKCFDTHEMNLQTWLLLYLTTIALLTCLDNF